VDGDTIYVDQTRLRLLSIDAFELAQTCTRDGQAYPCGKESTRALIRLIGQRPVQCEGTQRDRYGRPLVHCRIGNLDLGRAMVAQGWALAEYGTEYRQDQRTAQASRLGAWAGSFERPKDWRRSHPHQ
jgi:endonuclease YncB( thermonuclease family)